MRKPRVKLVEMQKKAKLVKLPLLPELHTLSWSWDVQLPWHSLMWDVIPDLYKSIVHSLCTWTSQASVDTDTNKLCCGLQQKSPVAALWTFPRKQCVEMKNKICRWLCQVEEVKVIPREGRGDQGHSVRQEQTSAKEEKWGIFWRSVQDVICRQARGTTGSPRDDPQPALAHTHWPNQNC